MVDFPQPYYKKLKNGENVSVSAKNFLPQALLRMAEYAKEGDSILYIKDADELFGAMKRRIIAAAGKNVILDEGN